MVTLNCYTTQSGHSRDPLIADLRIRWPPWSFTNPTWHNAPLCLHWSAIVPLFSSVRMFADGWFT